LGEAIKLANAAGIPKSGDAPWFKKVFHNEKDFARNYVHDH
jgi:hypothetical protein